VHTQYTWIHRGVHGVNGLLQAIKHQHLYANTVMTTTQVIAAHELHIEGLHVQLDTVTQE
jgi:hypothetical protein